MTILVYKGRTYKVRKTNGKLIILFGVVEIPRNKHNGDLFSKAEKALGCGDTDNTNVIDLSDKLGDQKRSTKRGKEGK